MHFRHGPSETPHGSIPVEAMHRRVVVCALVILAFFCLLVVRLWQVQVLQGTRHRRKAQRQSVRLVWLNAVRGRIFADGQTLVDNEAHYDLVFYVSEMRQPGRQVNTVEHILETERSLAAYLGREPALERRRVQRQRQYDQQRLHHRRPLRRLFQ